MENNGHILCEYVLNHLNASNSPSIEGLANLVIKHPHIIKLQESIGFQFKNPVLLLNALSHKSFSHEWRSLKFENNEKLEFLGDTILSSIISTEIFVTHFNEKEGNLSKLRGSLVNEECLFSFAEKLQLSDYILLGKGELYSANASHTRIISNAFEAIIGAIYLDSNFDHTYKILINFIKEIDPNILSLDQLQHFDYKSKLQEKTMAIFKSLPEYKTKTISKDGKNIFEVTLIIKNQEILTITNSSKKRAQKELAQRAIEESLLDSLI